MDVAKTIDFYGKDFLIRRPVLESIWGEQRYVLLFDEVDKASEELEYTLLEFLDDFSLSIPQYGTVKAKEGMASCLYQLQSLCLKQIPSISEGITWAGYLQKLMDDKDFNIADSLCMLCKNKEDQMRVRDAGILPNVKELS